MTYWENMDRRSAGNRGGDDHKAKEAIPSMPTLKLFGKIVLIGLFGILILTLGLSSCSTVPAGRVGVVSTFGEVSPNVLYPGIHFLNPFSSVYKLSTQTEAVEEEASVPSSEGLILTLKTTLLYHLDGACAPKVFRDIGPAYEQKVVEPVFRSSVREATASHPANALYSSERDSVGKQMTSDISRQLASQCFTVEGVLLKDVALPQTVQDAIEKKQQADQEAQAMEFRLQKERQEAERKRIEAQGIKDFQTIVSQGISEPLLRWKGIEATENLAKSPNAKVVIVGGKDGLPVILGNQ